jgi:O-antigen ligase
MERAQPLPARLLAAFGLLAAIVYVCTTDVGLYLPAAILAVAYCLWSFPRPAVAVSTIILMNAYVMEGSSEITPLEIGVGVYLYGYLAYWFVHRLLVAREPILKGTSDHFLVGFIALCVLSVVMLLAANSRIDYWARGILTISSLLLCFPAREAMRTRSGMMTLAGAFALLVLTLAVVNIVQYRASTLLANYLWEIWGGRKAFGSALYMALAVGAAGMYVHAEGGKQRALALLVGAVAIVALGTTFYRGFWIGTLISLVVLFLLVPRSGRVRLLWVGFLGAAASGLLVFLVAGDLAESVFRGVAARFTSTGNAMEDVSIANRIAETETVLRLVPQSPLVGFGYGAFFHHYNIITKSTEVVHYVHNVYVFLLLKVGAVGLFLFLGYAISLLWEGLRASRRPEESPFTLSMVRTSAAILVGLLFVGTNSGILEDKQVLLTITLAAAAITSRRETGR